MFTPTYADLELFYDGAIPAEALDALAAPFRERTPAQEAAVARSIALADAAMADAAADDARRAAAATVAAAGRGKDWTFYRTSTGRLQRIMFGPREVARAWTLLMG